MLLEDYLQSWLRHRMVLHEIVERLEDRHIEFKPWDDAMPLGSLVVHMVSSMDLFVRTVKNGEFSPREMRQFQSMDDVRKIVYDFTEETKNTIQSINEQHLEEEIKIFNFTCKGSFWLSNAHDHEIHHKGQLFTYARMAGVENLPFFIIQPPISDK